MARVYLRPLEAVLVLGVSRMTLNIWDKAGKIKKVVRTKRCVYYVVNANLNDSNQLTDIKPVRCKRANPKR